MEKFAVSVARDREVFHFEVIDQEKEPCEFEVYNKGTLVAVFEPDENEYIHICRNPGGLDEEVIVMIADQIESHFL
jgi:hypothetical protein